MQTLTYAFFTPIVLFPPVSVGEVAVTRVASPGARGDPGERPREREEAGRPSRRLGRQDLDRLGLAPARPIAGAPGDRRRAARPPATRRTPEGKTDRACRPPL